jgi:hypothetical protein
MRVFYTSGYENFKKASRTYIRSTPQRRISFHLQMWGLLVVGLLLVLLLSSSHVVSGPLRLVLIPIAAGLIGGGAVAPLIRPWQMERVYKAINGDPKKPLRIYLDIEGDILVSGIEGKSEGRFQRGAICDTAEDNEMLLLLLTKKRFIYIPKKDLPERTMQELLDWLHLPGDPNKC